MAVEVVAEFMAKLGLNVNEAEFKKGDTALGDVGSTLKKLALAAVGFFAVHKIKEWIGETVHAGASAVGMSRKMGVSIESVQELAFAAEETGTSVEALGHSMGKLGKGLKEEFVAGTGPILSAFGEMGISASVIKTKMSGPGGLDDVLALVSDSISKMPDGFNKNAIAMQLFGRSGVEMVPLLNKGAAGIADLRAEAHEFGQVLSDEDARTAKRVSMQWKHVEAGFGGVRNEIVVAFLPLISEIGEGIVEGLKSAIGWLKDHKEEIAGVAVAIGTTVKTVIGWITEGLGIIYDVATQGVEMVKTLGGGLLDVGVAIMEFFEWLASTLAGVWSLIMKGVTLIGHAFLWVKAQVMDFVHQVMDGGRKVIDFFVDVATSVKDAFIAAFDAVVDGAKAVGNAIADLPVIKQAISAVKFIGGKVSGFGSDAMPGGGGNDDLAPDVSDDAAAAASSREPMPAAAYSPTAQPHASLGGAKVNTFQMGDINIQAPPGVDAAGLAAMVETKVRDATGEWWDNQMSHAAATVEETA